MAVTLFDNKQDCCGCGACANACSQNAIRLIADEYGFLYPQIDADLCIECGACQQVCGYQLPPQKRLPMACYAATAKNKELLRKSSSGGVFAALATEILEQGGIVYGAAMPLEDACFSPKHLRISNLKDISLLQGSKYVQSDIGSAYTQAKEDLKKGIPVLFSGTPCQIAGLLRFLGREYDNLLTIELICHGVPNAKMFQEFITGLEMKWRKRVTGFRFRTKEKDLGKAISVEFCDDTGRKETKLLNVQKISYMHYFQNACISRASCYSCLFATAERTADITVGDYWGFHREHPEIRPKTQLSNARGVSCVLVNSEKGKQALFECQDALTLMGTRYDSVARHNEQLCRPAVAAQEREYVLELYRQEGYTALEEHFRKAYRKERFIQNVVSRIPGGVKRTIARVAGWTRRLAGE